MATETIDHRESPVVSAGRKMALGQPNARLRIGILIVAYNALTTLRQVLRRIPKSVYAEVEEVVVFDDASPDATYELATGLKALGEFEKLHVFRNEKNLGYGGNQKAGYRYFSAKGFDVVVLLHGDGQYAPEMLSAMYEPIVKGEASAVFGSRMMKDYGGPLKGGMPLYKYVGNRILTAYENRALQMNLTEFHSGYRAYSLDALRRIDLDSLTDDFHFDTQIIVKLNHQGFRIKEIPIPTYYGDEICYVNGIRYAWDVFRTVRRYKATIDSLEKFLEYKEYYVHYPIKQGKYSSHYYALRMTGTESDIIELGCGSGLFAAELIARGNRVTGVDWLNEPTEVGGGFKYLRADLNSEQPSKLAGLKGQRFEKVLLMDLLEHLNEPAKLLGDCRSLLKANGIVIISVPNVANISVRLLLLCGRFNYTERGILDKTHVRFFTRSTIRRLIQDCGYEVMKEFPSVIPLDLALRASHRNPFVRAMTACLNVLTRLCPTLLGYQFIYAVRTNTRAS